MSHPLSPAPLSPRYRDGALRPGQLRGGGIVPGMDPAALRQAESLRVANQSARGARQVLRPLYTAFTPHTIVPYLIDSANPDTELRLNLLEPDGIDFGLLNGRQRDIIIRLEPVPTAGEIDAYAKKSRFYGNHYLAVNFTWSASNIGPEPAELRIHIDLDDIDYTHSWTSAVTWTNRPTNWDTERATSDDSVVEATIGGGMDVYDDYDTWPTSLVQGETVAPVNTLTSAFSQALEETEEDLPTPWTGRYYATALPMFGWYLTAKSSFRYTQWSASHDHNLNVECKFYGAKFASEI
jgi:hypothetical protein